MEVATSFFHACETGKGWAGCSEFCTPDSSFTVQAVDAIPSIQINYCKTVEQYTDLMKKLVEDFGEAATYDVDASAFDSATGKAIFCCTFGGFTHYVYTIEVKDDKVVAMTKVWNDAYAATKM